MVRPFMTAVAGALIIGAATTGTSYARLASSSCAHGAVSAVINAEHVCLRSGATCRGAFARQYARYGFKCGAVLVRKAKATAVTPKEATTPTTTAATAPSNPFVGTWSAFDVSDGSLERAVFAASGTLLVTDASARTCDGDSARATATGTVHGKIWTADAPTTVFCDNSTRTIAGHL